MPRRTRAEIEERASQEFFKYYMKSPKAIRNISKPFMKTAIRTGRKLKPYTDKGVLQANVWIDTNIKGNRAVRIASAVTGKLTTKKKPVPQKKKKSIYDSVLSSL